MKTGKKGVAVWFVLGCFVLWAAFLARPAKADTGILPAASDNLVVGLRSTSELVATKDGYMRVYYDGVKIGIEYYDDSFAIQSKRSLDMELDLWGGFYAGSDAYYLVEGQSNTAQSDTAEVIRVIRYDKGWNKKGTARITGSPEIFGGEVRYPFDYGCVEMAECGGTLYIVTGHEGYVDPAYNQGHQGFLMIAVDEASMTGGIVDCDLWHSFAQYISARESDLYVLEQSEGSRYTKLSRYDAKTLENTSLPVLEYGGSRDSAWAVPCYASVDGMAVSSGHVLCLGTSIDQSGYDSVSSDTAHNIYLTVTPLSDFSGEATTVKWLTHYSGGGKSFLGTKITKADNDRFLVSWEESKTGQTAASGDGLSTSILHYIFVDGKGDPVSKEFTAAAPVSDCQPILKDGKIVYCASNANMVNFYSIDARTGAFGKTVYRVAGERASWDLGGDGVLTISGTGAMSVDPKARYRYPVSSVSGGGSYSSSDNAWKPVRDQVKKIVIRGGISSIPERAFAYFGALTEAELEPGVVSIGKEAFYSCGKLEKITIPASVTSIGEDFLWTGSYWVSDNSHVVQAKIYAPDGSYAMRYAKENNIRCTTNDISGSDDHGSGGNDSNGSNDSNDSNGSHSSGNTGTASSIAKAKVSGVKGSYAYNGKAQKPGVTVRLAGKKLKKDKDYKVSYSSNRSTGRATIKIRGIGQYSGTIKKTFKIVPKKPALPKLVSPKAKTVRVSWKKDPQASGYQIQYARNAKFTSGKRNIAVSGKSIVSKKISKLTKKKTYYVRVRAYKKIDGEKCYGSWSKTAKIKCR